MRLSMRLTIRKKLKELFFTPPKVFLNQYFRFLEEVTFFKVKLSYCGVGNFFVCLWLYSYSRRRSYFHPNKIQKKKTNDGHLAQSARKIRYNDVCLRFRT